MISGARAGLGASLIYNPPFVHCGINNRADQLPMAIKLLGRRHNHVLGQTHAGKRLPDSDGQIPFGAGDRHDDAKIHIAVRTCAPSCMRSEKNDHLGMESLDDAPDHLPDAFFRSGSVRWSMFHRIYSCYLNYNLILLAAGICIGIGIDSVRDEFGWCFPDRVAALFESCQHRNNPVKEFLRFGVLLH